MPDANHPRLDAEVDPDDRKLVALVINASIAFIVLISAYAGGPKNTSQFYGTAGPLLVHAGLAILIAIGGVAFRRTRPACLLFSSILISTTCISALHGTKAYLGRRDGSWQWETSVCCFSLFTLPAGILTAVLGSRRPRRRDSDQAGPAFPVVLSPDDEASPHSASKAPESDTSPPSSGPDESRTS